MELVLSRSSPCRSHAQPCDLIPPNTKSIWEKSPTVCYHPALPRSLACGDFPGVRCMNSPTLWLLGDMWDHLTYVTPAKEVNVEVAKWWKWTHSSQCVAALVNGAQTPWLYVSAQSALSFSCYYLSFSNNHSSPGWLCHTPSPLLKSLTQNMLQSILDVFIGCGQVLRQWTIWFQTFLPRQIYGR